MKEFMLAAGMAAALMLPPAHADEVTDQIAEAQAAYKRKDLDTAVTALEAATTLIRQQKAEQIAGLLPEPLAGWQSEDRGGEYGGAMGMMGINAERVYTKELPPKGDEYLEPLEVSVSVVSDSPMLQAVSMMYSNPMFMGAGNKMVVINGRKVIHSRDENSLVVALGRMIITVRGSEGTPENEVMAYFKAVDLKALEKVGTE